MLDYIFYWRKKILAIGLFLIMVLLRVPLGIYFDFDLVASGEVLRVAFLGLLCVLFSEKLASYTGTVWTVGRVGSRIDRSSHPGMVEFVGWLLLSIPAVLFCLHLFL
jgi:hypothetical protein